MKKALLLVSLLLPFISLAQYPNWKWAKKAVTNSAGDSEGSNICTDKFGNTYVTGAIHSNTYFASTLLMTWGQEAFIAKYDSVGNLLWARKSSCTCGAPVSTSVSTDGIGNAYITGYFSCPIAFGNDTLNPSTGQPYTVFLVKYDPNGNELWAKASWSTSFGNQEGMAVIADAAGNSYITGTFESGNIHFGNDTLSGSLYASTFFVKYDPAGNVIWARQINGTRWVNGSGLSLDYYRNHVYLSGTFYDTTAIGGFSLHSRGNRDIFIAKYDTAGQVIWATSLGGSDDDSGGPIETDLQGNIYTGGNFASDTAYFGTAYLINTTAGKYDGYLAKYDSSGNTIWVKQIKGKSIDNVYDIGVDPKGNSFLSGSFHSDTISFAGSALTCSHTDTNHTSFYTAKYDSAGHPVWVYTNGNNNLGAGICADTNGYAYQMGNFNASLDFGAIHFFNLAGADLFIVKIGDTLQQISVADIYEANNVAIYPNPAGGIFTLLTNGKDIPFTIEDMYGQETYRSIATNKKYTVDLSFLQNGMYLIRAEVGAGRVTRKLIIQK